MAVDQERDADRFLFRICVDCLKKMQEFYHVVRMEGFLLCAWKGCR